MRSRFASASASSSSTREDVAVRLDRLVDVAELVLERLREATTDRALDVLSCVQAEDVGVRVGEGLPAAVDRAGEPRRLLAGLLVERELLERADVDVERAHRIDELVFEELRDAVVRGEALLVVRLRVRRRVRELRLVDAGELLPLARCAVERLEDLGDLDLLDAAARRALRGPRASLVLGRRVEDVAVRRDGRVDVRRGWCCCT